MNYYSGIGSRETPKEICLFMSKVCKSLSSSYTVRSGGARGADSAFECVENKDIYLTEKLHNNNASPLYIGSDLISDINVKEAEKISEMLHPNWEYLSSYAKLLMTRNVFQVLGHTLDKPSKFVICWTPDGCDSKFNRTRKSGGTGQAIALADEYSVPVYNLKKEKHLNHIKEMIGMKVVDINKYF